MALQEKENGIQIFFLRQNVPILAKHTNSILKESMLSQHTCAQLLSCVRLFVTPCPVARQAPLSMAFSRQESWSSCHFLLQGIFQTQGSNLYVLCVLHCSWILYLLSHQESPHTNPRIKNQCNSPYQQILKITWLSR